MVQAAQKNIKNRSSIYQDFRMPAKATAEKVATNENNIEQLPKNVLSLNPSKYPSYQLPETSPQVRIYATPIDPIAVRKQRKSENKVSEWRRILRFPLVTDRGIDIASQELKITIDRVHELIEEDEEDEYGEVVNPTEYAIQKAIEILSGAAALIPNDFFKAWVSCEDTGGIRLTWSKPELKKQVRLVVPPSGEKQIYLYHEKNDEYGVLYNISAKTLSNRLRWLNSKK